MSTFNLDLDDDLQAEVVAWGRKYGLPTKAAAIRVLLRMALRAEQQEESKS